MNSLELRKLGIIYITISFFSINSGNQEAIVNDEFTVTFKLIDDLDEYHNIKLADLGQLHNLLTDFVNEYRKEGA